MLVVKRPLPAVPADPGLRLGGAGGPGSRVQGSQRVQETPGLRSGGPAGPGVQGVHGATYGPAKSLPMLSNLGSSTLVGPFLNSSILGFHSNGDSKGFFTKYSRFVQQKQGKQGQQTWAKILKTKEGHIEWLYSETVWGSNALLLE